MRRGGEIGTTVTRVSMLPASRSLRGPPNKVPFFRGERMRRPGRLKPTYAATARTLPLRRFERSRNEVLRVFRGAVERFGSTVDPLARGSFSKSVSAFLVISLVAVGCRIDEPPSGPVARSRPAAQLGSEAQHVPSGERLFAELARLVPTSAGFFFDEAGPLIVNVSNPADADRATQAVRNFLDRGDIVTSNPASVIILPRTVKYSYNELSRWRNLLFDSAVTSLSDLVMLDLDERRNQVVVGSVSAALTSSHRAVTELLGRANGDTGALRVVVAEPLRPSSVVPRLGFFTWTALTASADTVVGGLHIGQSGVWECTLGFTADFPNFGLGFVTASHCTADIWNEDGRVANQTYWGPQAGVEVADPGPWSCGIFQLCRRSDAAFFQRTQGRPMIRGLIARPNAIGSGNVDASDPYFIVIGSSNGILGQQIYKIGKTTNWTTGYITYTCQDRQLTGFPGYERTVRCTNESSNPDQGGDSGGPLFLPVGGPYVYLSGTTIGGAMNGSGTGWSTISQLQLDFGNVLTVTRVATLTTPAVTGSLPSGVPVLNWSPISGATNYDVFKSTGGTFFYEGVVTSGSYSDGSVSVVSVHSSPPAGVPWVAYYVRAHAPGNYSASSNILYFRKNAIVASIQGQAAVKPNEICFWSVAASGGTGNYTYQWRVNGQPVGSNSSQLAYSAGSSFTLSVTVSDGAGTPPGNDSRSISVSGSNPSCGF